MPETLEARVRARGPRPLPEVTRIVGAVSRAVGQLHLRKRGHGGIVPTAITWIPGEGARAARIELAPPRTSVVSLLAWQPPEHFVSCAAASPAADVWSLGLVTYFALTGHVLWRSAAAAAVDPVALVSEMQSPPAASTRAAEQRVRLPRPGGVDAWLARCLAPDPAARFRSATRASHALLAVLRADGAASGVVGVRATLVDRDVSSGAHET